VVAEKTKENIEGKYAVQHYSYISLSLSQLSLSTLRRDKNKKTSFFFFFFLIEMMEGDQYNFPLERDHSGFHRCEMFNLNHCYYLERQIHHHNHTQVQANKAHS
jgi:hypothetical protein